MQQVDPMTVILLTDLMANPRSRPNLVTRLQDTALQELEESLQILRRVILSSYRSSYEGIAKFRKRLGKHSTNQIVSEFYKFGSVQYLKKISPASKSVLKRA